MARFSGKVGFVENTETRKGIWTGDVETVRHYYGDVSRVVRRLENGTDVNDDIQINNEISIVADPYARDHFFAIRWIEWQGVKWRVTSAEVLYPRLVLSLGGVWHGDA